MSQTLPNPPYGVPVADSSGRMSNMWAAFIKVLYSRVGNAEALSNTELAAIHDSAVTTLQAKVAVLQITVISLQSQITTGLSDLGQGRIL